MIVVAIIGAVVNAASALLFMSGRKQDLNRRSAFVHLASDAVLAVGVAIAGALILVTGWLWLDPAVSIALALTILAGTWSLLRKSLDLMLDAVPEGIDPEEVKVFLGTLPRVVEVHDLHIWAMSTTETALTAHLVMPANSSAPTFLADACKALHERFEIDHATPQSPIPEKRRRRARWRPTRSSRSRRSSSAVKGSSRAAVVRCDVAPRLGPPEKGASRDALSLRPSGV